MPTEPLRELVIASGNAGKLAELRELLSGRRLRLRSQDEFAIPAIAETATSFIENALLKARHASACTGLPALADDSGLVVDALDGAPGVRSARYAGERASDAANNLKLLAALQDVPDPLRGARFHCVLVLLRHPGDPMPLVCSGTWEGHIGRSASGKGGFGYDPLFVPAGLAQSVAELPAATKNRLSHRAQALAALLEALGTPA